MGKDKIMKNKSSVELFARLLVWIWIIVCVDWSRKFWLWEGWISTYAELWDYIWWTAWVLWLLASVLFFFESLKLQRRELKLTRDELTKSANAQEQSSGVLRQTAELNALSSLLKYYSDQQMIDKRNNWLTQENRTRIIEKIESIVENLGNSAEN